MTTVGGTLSQPGLVTFYLVDQDNRHVHDGFVAGGTIVGETYVQTDSAGVYTVALAGNADIQADATATYWVRSFGFSSLKMLVPVSGTWDELQIAADPPPASPDPVATNLITSAAVTSAVNGLAVNVFQFADVAGTTVTVPDLTYSVKIEAVAPIVCPATANIDVGAFITLTSGDVNKGADYHWAGTANLPYTCRPIAVLPPHSAGSYKMRVYSFSTVTLNVDAQTGQPAGLWVYADMNVHLTPEQRWVCPNCTTTAVTHEHRPHSQMHVCRGLRGLSAPMVPAGMDCKVEAVERDDYVGKEMVQTDGAGRPIMSIVTTRADGSNDCAVLAPCATATGEAHAIR